MATVLVQNHTLEQQLKFPLQWRFFCRKAHIPTVKSLLKNLNFDAEVTALEIVFDKLRDLMP